MHDPKLINDDLAPTPPEKRTWSKWHIAALWVGMSVCIPTYLLASGLIDQGWSLKMAVLSVALGNVVVLFPMVLNAHAGTRYGIPFPVLLRSSFGVIGSNIPALMRALVACGWFGINTWIGGKALYILVGVVFPDVTLPHIVPAWFGITTGQFLAFMAFWAINVAIIVRGIDSIRVLETWAAPLLLIMGWGGNTATWNPQLEGLAEQYHVIAFVGLHPKRIGLIDRNAVARCGIQIHYLAFDRAARRASAAPVALRLPASVVSMEEAHKWHDRLAGSPAVQWTKPCFERQTTEGPP